VCPGKISSSCLNSVQYDNVLLVKQELLSNLLEHPGSVACLVDRCLSFFLSIVLSVLSTSIGRKEMLHNLFLRTAFIDWVISNMV
jgi:hypothetical protein